MLYTYININIHIIIIDILMNSIIDQKYEFCSNKIISIFVIYIYHLCCYISLYMNI